MFWGPPVDFGLLVENSWARSYVCLLLHESHTFMFFYVWLHSHICSIIWSIFILYDCVQQFLCMCGLWSFWNADKTPLLCVKPTSLPLSSWEINLSHFLRGQPLYASLPPTESLFPSIRHNTHTHAELKQTHIRRTHAYSLTVPDTCADN